MLFFEGAKYKYWPPGSAAWQDLYFFSYATSQRTENQSCVWQTM